MVKSQDKIEHSGVMGMKWGKHKTQEDPTHEKTTSKIERAIYKIGAKANPREFKYRGRKLINKVNDDIKLLAELTISSVKQNGVLPANAKALRAIESVGIKTHKEKVYDNLNPNDIKNLKVYTDSARYSRGINTYLATGEPKAYASEAGKLKRTLQKNAVDDQVVFRSCNLKFTTEGLAKKLDQSNEKELEKAFGSMSSKFSGKTLNENRVFSTSTSPLFAIDTWRAVNPTAASTYNTYMVINCKKCPGVLADGQTKDGQSLVNTRSNQEAILAPNKLTYKKMEFDKERQMFAITVDAT